MEYKQCLILAILYFLISVHRGQSQKRCKCKIPHGRVSWCYRDDMTAYNCDEGYEEATSWLTCSSSGQWLPLLDFMTVTDLCIPKSCPKRIPNGFLSPSCTAKVGTSCEYTCYSGYRKTFGQNIITCETSTNWSVNPHALCTKENQCPYEVTNGGLSLSCRRHPGDTCTFTCHEGYLHSEQNTVSCGPALTWSQPLDKVCKEIRCPRTIPNGYIETSCTMGYKTYCGDYRCDPGYVKARAGPTLKCNATGQWEWYEGEGQPCAREVDMCPSNIKNGEVVWHCHRQPGARCTYHCNPGCTATLNVVWLKCGEGGKWRENTDTLCTDCRLVPTTTTRSNLCPFTIPDGYISLGCRRTVYSSCEITCYDGCYRTGRTVYCTTGLYWSGNYCKCEVVESSYSRHTGSGVLVVVGGVGGGVLVLIIIIIAVVWIGRSRRRPAGRTQYASPQPVVYSSAPPARTTQNSRVDGILSPTYMMTNQDTHYTSLQTQQNSEQRSLSELQPTSHYTDSSYAQEPPAYITVSKIEPPDPPPSYEEVTSNPTDFNA